MFWLAAPEEIHPGILSELAKMTLKLILIDMKELWWSSEWASMGLQEGEPAPYSLWTVSHWIIKPEKWTIRLFVAISLPKAVSNSWGGFEKIWSHPAQAASFHMTRSGRITAVSQVAVIVGKWHML